jgi:hypothetical protein
MLGVVNINMGINTNEIDGTSYNYQKTSSI